MQKSSKELSKMQKNPKLQPFPCSPLKESIETGDPRKALASFSKNGKCNQIEKAQAAFQKRYLFAFWSALFTFGQLFRFLPKCNLAGFALFWGAFRFWSALFTSGQLF